MNAYQEHAAFMKSLDKSAHEPAPDVMYYSRTRFLTDGTTDRVECCANWWPPLNGAELLPDCTWSDGIFRIKLHWPDNFLA